MRLQSRLRSPFTVPAMAEDVVNFGVQPSTQPILIAHGAGYLKPIEEKYKIKIVLRSFSYGAPENQALAAGELQIASAGMGPAILAAARLPATLVAIDILDQTAILVPKDSKITTVAGLKGAKIAYPGEGSQQYPLLIKALADAKLTLKDVQLFKTDGSQVATLLANKSVDAGITWDPHVSRALADGVGPRAGKLGADHADQERSLCRRRHLCARRFHEGASRYRAGPDHACR